MACLSNGRKLTCRAGFATRPIRFGLPSFQDYAMSNLIKSTPTGNALPQPNAWLLQPEAQTNPFSITFRVAPDLVKSVIEGDGVAILSEQDGQAVTIAFARIFRIRSSPETTTFYFDTILPVAHPTSSFIRHTPAFSNSSLPFSRLDWTTFAAALKSATGKNFDELPPLEGKTPAEQTYLRRLLQFAVMDDLLGPANGPFEEVIGMSVRDRYLVGKLAPKTLGPTSPFAGLSRSAVTGAPSSP